jgi:hypothetical protein
MEDGIACWAYLEDAVSACPILRPAIMAGWGFATYLQLGGDHVV